MSQRWQYSAIGTSRSTSATSSKPRVRSAMNSVVEQLLLEQDRHQCAETEGIRARANLQMVVGHLGGLGAAGIHHDQTTLGVLGNLLQRNPRARETVRLPGVLAEKNRDLRLFVVTGGVATRLAEELAIDPELAGLLLRQRVRCVHRAKRRPRSATVPAAQVIPLAAAAVVENRLATVLVAHRGESLSHLGDRRVPVDLLERAIGATTHRRSQPVASVLVMIQTMRLLACIALRAGMLLVAAHLGDPPALGLDLEPAIDAAENARCLLPLGHRRRSLVSSVVRLSAFRR